jgi:hypothetical protein
MTPPCYASAVTALAMGEHVPQKQKPQKPEPERHKAAVRFTERQWKQIRAHLFKHNVTFQSLVIDALAHYLEKFDVT